VLDAAEPSALRASPLSREMSLSFRRQRVPNARKCISPKVNRIDFITAEMHSIDNNESSTGKQEAAARITHHISHFSPFVGWTPNPHCGSIAIISPSGIRKSSPATFPSSRQTLCLQASPLSRETPQCIVLILLSFVRPPDKETARFFTALTAHGVRRKPREFGISRLHS
jgi:hypothetical protein